MQFLIYSTFVIRTSSY